MSERHDHHLGIDLNAEFVRPANRREDRRCFSPRFGFGSGPPRKINIKGHQTGCDVHQSSHQRDDNAHSLRIMWRVVGTLYIAPHRGCSKHGHARNFFCRFLLHGTTGRIAIQQIFNAGQTLGDEPTRKSLGFSPANNNATSAAMMAASIVWPAAQSVSVTFSSVEMC